jgi:hypothetical protein
MITQDEQPQEPTQAPQQADETPKPSASREALVGEWSKKIRTAKSHWEADFKRMRNNMKFARGLQWLDQKSEDDPRYVANLVLRHVANKVAALYAKNPKAVAHRRKRLDFQLWDGNPESVMQAQMTLQTLAEQFGPMAQAHPEFQQAQALLEDVQQGTQYRQMIDRIGKTLEVVFEHQLLQQKPVFKKQMKQLVRRAITTSVGYVKLGFKRTYDVKPEHAEHVTEMADRLARIERQMKDVADEKIHEYEAEADELRSALQSLQQEPDMFVSEGLDLDFPVATSIIIDPACRQLDGFLGARWVAQEYLLPPDKVKEVYKVDVSRKFRPYNKPDPDSAEAPEPLPVDSREEAKEGQNNVCVWEVYDSVSGLVYHIADGYPDFLREPHAPLVKLERFYPFFTLTFNEVEDENALYPPSDVTLLRPMQTEHNISRDRLREHRDAARPKYVAPKGKLTPADKTNLTDGPPHSVVELEGLQPGEDVGKVLQHVPYAPIDPNLYETGQLFDDAMKVSGIQEANMGGTSGDTATEASIAEASRMTSIGSNVDDLDDFLTELARNASYVLLTEMTVESVQDIAGPGAVWPEMTADDVAKDLWLIVRAGSSGRPNKAQEIQNFERLAPLLMQIPGVSPEWMAREAIERLDDRIDLEDAFQAGLQSITLMNHQPQPAGGTPGQTQYDQAGAGPENAPSPDQSDANIGPNNNAMGPPDASGRPTAQIHRGVSTPDAHRSL